MDYYRVSNLLYEALSQIIAELNGIEDLTTAESNIKDIAEKAIERRDSILGV